MSLIDDAPRPADTAAHPGLPATEAGRRLAADGPNRLPEPPRRSRLALFLDQFRNLLDAREKVRALVERALTPPLPRRRTRPTVSAQRRRVAEKQRRSEVKRVRSRVRGED